MTERVGVTVEAEPERGVYGGGNGPTGVTKVRGGDAGDRLTVAEGVVLREACVGGLQESDA